MHLVGLFTDHAHTGAMARRESFELNLETIPEDQEWHR